MRPVVELGEQAAARMGDEFIAAVRTRRMANVDVALKPLSPEVVKAAAAELSSSLAWVNNGQCSERALMSALMIGRRAAGNLDGFLGEGVTDAMSAGVASVRTTSVQNSYARMHVAPAFRIQGDPDTWVFDALYSPNPIRIGEWASKPGAKPDTVRVFSPFVGPAVGSPIPGTSHVRPPIPYTAEQVRHIAARVLTPD